MLLLGSTALAAAWALHDPGAAAGVVPGSLAGGGGGPHRAIGLAAGQAATLSISIFTNNIIVTFTSCASGILFGVAPAFFPSTAECCSGRSGNRRRDRAQRRRHRADRPARNPRVVVHRGQRRCRDADGWALVEPGSRRRTEALSAEAPRAVLMVLATAPWLIVAGLVEGFVTPHHLPLLPALAIGIGVAAPAGRSLR